MKIILTLSLLLCFSAAASAGLTVDATPLPRLEPPRVSSYATMLEKASLSVVSVYPATLIKAADVEGEKEFIDRYFGKGGSEGEAQNRRENGHGSGVIVSADGLILTNNHVVRTPADTLADEIMVELQTGRRYPAKIIGTDPLTDIALLKMEPVADGPPLPIASSDAVRTGDLVFAIGSPFDVGMTVTMGCVSATHRTGLQLNGPGSYEDFIQTDAAINPGNSGGALIDAAGRLIGINTAIRNAGGGGNIGIGFAVPSALAVWVADQLRATGKVQRGRLGLDAVTAKPSESSPAGVKLTGVHPGGPAEKAGLKMDDILTALNAQPVVSESQLRLRVSLMVPGSAGEATVFREGKTLTLPVTFAAATDDGGDGSAEVLPGVKLAVSDEPKGLKIVTVRKDSPFVSKLEVGRVIIVINGNAVTSLGEARAALRAGVNQVETAGKDGKTALTTLRLNR